MRKNGLWQRIFGVIDERDDNAFISGARYDYYFYLQENKFRFYDYVADEDLSRDDKQTTYAYGRKRHGLS